MHADFDFDIYISYSHLDAEKATELAQKLNSNGFAVWFDRWKIEPGDSIPLKIEDALAKSRTLLLLVSSNSIGSEWVRLERSAVLFRDPTNESRRFIPIRLDDAPLPDSLRQFAYVDWREHSEEQYQRLVTACRPKDLSLPSISPERQLTPKAFYESIVGLAASSDGSVAVSASPPRTFGIWDVRKGSCTKELSGHSKMINAVAISADGKVGFSCSDDGLILIWGIEKATLRSSLKGHRGAVTAIASTEDGRILVSGGRDGTLRVWETDSGRCLNVFEEGDSEITCVGIDAVGRNCFHGTSDGLIRVWEIVDGACLSAMSGHTLAVTAMAVSADGCLSISGSRDLTLRVWSIKDLRCVATLEGHTKPINAVALTPDGRFAASSSDDKTIRVWNVSAGECIAVLTGHTDSIYGLSITSDGKRLISGSADHSVKVWNLESKGSESHGVRAPSKYTNAKVLLVGQSGVGKTGLAMRLTKDQFEASISSDAAWATQLKIPYVQDDAGEDREIWLWDFAGQSDYRLIHQLFMDETALAVLVFNPQDENPFESLAQWDNDIQRAASRPFKKILVAGRCDRGGVVVSQETIQGFVAERCFSHFVETSAASGNGCAELRRLIVETIPWAEIPWTASPRIFRLLKDGILAMRDSGYVLIRFVELKQQLELSLPGEHFSVDQLRAVIGLLTGPGVVKQLEFGDFVLLKPEYVNAYASAVIRTVRSHVDEIGTILEEDVINGKLRFEDVQRLPQDQESVVLREMYQMFVDKGLCLREHTDAGSLLIFPSYFKRERKEIDQHPAEFIAFTFSGSLDEIYATLVVRLLHTKLVEKEALWKWAADFRTPANKRIGIKISKKAEGSAELVVYMEPDVSDDAKIAFVRYVYDHLRSRDPSLGRRRFYVCSSCGEPVKDAMAVETRKQKGFVDIGCSHCDHRIPLHDLMEEKFLSPEVQDAARKMEREARTVIDNESKELILVGHAFSIAGEAGQIFRATPNSDWGIDGEIEFKDEHARATGKRLYLQLKSGDSYLRLRKSDGKQVFYVSNARHLSYWKAQSYPVMLVIRTSDSQIQWMDVSRYLKDQKSDGREIEFEGEPFNAASLLQVRDKQLSLVGYVESLAQEAGHTFRIVRSPEWGVDGVIELIGRDKKSVGILSLQLRADVAYRSKAKGKSKVNYTAAFPGRVGKSELPRGRIMLVARSALGNIEWMDVSQHLRNNKNDPPSFDFVGKVLTVEEINRIRDQMIGTGR